METRNFPSPTEVKHALRAESIEWRAHATKNCKYGFAMHVLAQEVRRFQAAKRSFISARKKLLTDLSRRNK